MSSRYSNGARASARSSRSRSPARRPHLLHGQHPSHASRRSGGGRDSRATGRSGRSSRATRDRSGRDYSRDYNRDYSRDRRNDRYSRRSRSQSSQESGSLSSDDDGSSGDERDDSEGHFKGKAGSMIDGRYKVIEESGVGTFGRVLLCEDTHHAGRRVAMKVVRAIKKYSSSARLEAEILRKVNRRDKGGRSRIVTLFDTFEWDGHVCMVFEALGKSLYDYVKMNHYKPLPLRCVQTFSEQLLQSIAFLHSMKLVHTDLKPENVLLVPTSFRKVTAATMKRDRRRVLEPFEKTIKLIDFGGATFESDHHSTIVNTRQYRAPEVILQLGWGPPSDIWSAACIIMELYVGELLFSTHDNREHLALMQRVLGPIPSHMVQRARGPACDFFQRGELVWPGRKTAYDRIEAVKKTLPLEQIIHPHDDIFVDFMRGLLTFDPRKRLTAEQALKHRFFNPPKSSAPRVSAAAKRKAPAAKAVKPSAVTDSVGAGGGAGSSGHGAARPRKTTIGSAANGNGNGHASGSRNGTAKR